MITLSTVRDVHRLIDGLQALRLRLEVELGDRLHTTDLKSALSETAVSLYNVARETEALVRTQNNG